MTMMTKKYSKYILVLGIFFSVFCSLANAAPKALDEIAAIVNNDVILESDVQQMLNSIKDESRAQENLPNDTILRKQVIDHLISNELMLQQAKKLNISVTELQLDQAINQIAQQNNTTTAQLQAEIKKSGISYLQYREEIRKQILMDEARNAEVQQKITIQPQEVENLLKQLSAHQNDNIELNLSHILLALPENPTQSEIKEAEKKAELIITKVKQGESFSKLATTYSNDSYALKGGVLGWGKLAEFPSLFADALKTAKKGEIVGPLRSGAGLHILRVNDLRGNTSEKVSTTQYHARHILLKSSIISSDEDIQRQLITLLQQIKNKQITFAQAAEKYSQDPGSAENGGDLGWIRPDILDPTFAKTMVQLKTNEISQPIKSAFGWHIIQLLGKRTIDITSDQEKNKAYQMIYNRKFSEEFPIWLQELRSQAYIKIYSDE